MILYIYLWGITFSLKVVSVPSKTFSTTPAVKGRQYLSKRRLRCIVAHIGAFDFFATYITSFKTQIKSIWLNQITIFKISLFLYSFILSSFLKRLIISIINKFILDFAEILQNRHSTNAVFKERFLTFFNSEPSYSSVQLL